MTREESAKYIKEWLKDEWMDPKDRAVLTVAFEAVNQEPCEDEYIKVPKNALKYRTAEMVAYNVEWLKNNFDMERAVICGEPAPYEGSEQARWRDGK